jgi:hypothetical protein
LKLRVVFRKEDSIARIESNIRGQAVATFSLLDFKQATDRHGRGDQEPGNHKPPVPYRICGKPLDPSLFGQFISRRHFSF